MTPIVDAHVHLWDPNRLSYPWLKDVPVLNRAYLLEDYRQACGRHDVRQMVFLQCECEQYLEEARWVSQLAEKDSRIAGIVPWAPLELGEEARPALEQLTQDPLVKGVRRIIQFEADPAFCLQPKFIRGVQMLAEFGLSFDICIAHHQLANTIALVRQCPDVQFVLDHIAKPDIKNQILDPWRAQLKELAAMPNVWCKVSGLVVEADHQQWAAKDLMPYLTHVLDTFGFDRVMFGGDWPVIVQASPLSRWIETLQEAVCDRSEAQQKKLFHDNAVRFYRL